MQKEFSYYGYFLEEDQNHDRVSFRDGQWLEELGAMMEAAAQGLRKDQFYLSDFQG